MKVSTPSDAIGSSKIGIGARMRRFLKTCLLLTPFSSNSRYKKNLEKGLFRLLFYGMPLESGFWKVPGR